MSINHNLKKYEFASRAKGSYSSLDCDKENNLPEPEQVVERDVLQESFKFTPRFLHISYNQWAPSRRGKCSLSTKLSKDRMTGEICKPLEKNPLKRKLSLRSQQHLIPLSDKLRQERGEIGECSTSANTAYLDQSASSTSTLSCKSVSQIVRQEIRHHLLNLKLSDRIIKKSHNMSAKKELKQQEAAKISFATVSNFNLVENFEFLPNPEEASAVANLESEDRSTLVQTDVTESGNQSDSHESESISVGLHSDPIIQSDEKTASQKNFRAALQMQIEKWKRQLLKLKESTEIIERIAFNNHFMQQYKFGTSSDDCVELGAQLDESSAITPLNESPDSNLDASLRVVYSQLENDEIPGTPDSCQTSAELLQPTFSCYAKMNEIEHRLSDMELRMASIHEILRVVRQQQYNELKVRKKILKTQKRSEAIKTDMENAEQKIQHEIGDCKPAIVKAISSNSEPPIIMSGSSMFMTDLNPYDESYYEWRQYRMNLLYYKKSERTIALNRRPTLHVMEPPIMKYFESTENKYRKRVKKPFFIVTPSRTKEFWQK